jgi:hypothetical protein
MTSIPDPIPGQILLRPDIVDSELWKKPTHIVLAWLTMALSCDEDYHVDGSLPWLATAANISIEELLNALADLSSPCLHFASESNPDGILVEETEVGWRLIVDPENPLFIPSGDPS